MSDLNIAIIGTGFSGLGIAIRLRKAGFDDFTLFERAGEIGGTWRDNAYPGCACDIPSHLYSFSFEPNPNWSRKYSSRNEIHAYMKHCFEKYDLAERTRFNTEIVEARYRKDARHWTLKTGDGESFTASILIAGMGPLNKPSIPEISGLQDFKGEKFHSSHWKHDFDLRDKAIAVVGTGASAIQIVPAIVDGVKRIDLYQRTPPWVVPRWDHAYSKLTKTLFRALPPLHRAYRSWIYWFNELFGFAFVTKSRVYKSLRKLALWNLRKAIEDPALVGKLTPDYRIGCKRILFSDDYYPALARKRVNVISDPIERVTENGVVAGGVERPIDALVLGTGFNVTEFVTPMRIFGNEGQELGEMWRGNVETYLGITVVGFPNFFVLVGPNTGLGHNSLIFMIEAQVHYILSCIRGMRKRKAASVELRQDVQQAFSAGLQKRMTKTVWLSGCRSWYLREDGKNFTLWPGFTVDYWLRTRRVNHAHYLWEPGIEDETTRDVASMPET